MFGDAPAYGQALPVAQPGYQVKLDRGTSQSRALQRACPLSGIIFREVDFRRGNLLFFELPRLTARGTAFESVSTAVHVSSRGTSMTGAAGQPDLAALYLLHRDAMYRMAYSVLRGAGRTSDAEDVVSDAVVSVMTSQPLNVRSWEAFLLTVVKRKALDRIKSAEVRHAGPALVEAVHDRTDGADIEDEVLDAIEREELAVRMDNYLEVLDVRHRKAVWETVALERPRAEVAVELNVTPSRISQMTTRALAQLRDEMSNRREANDGRQRA